MIDGSGWLLNFRIHMFVKSAVIKDVIIIKPLIIALLLTKIALFWR